MRVVTNKHDICEVLNLGKYPVITVDTAVGFSSNLLRVRYACQDDVMYLDARLNWYKDSDQVVFEGEPTIITNNDLGYDDVIDMCKRSWSPIIKESQEVVVVIYNSRLRRSRYPIVVKTGDRVKFGTQVLLNIAMEDREKLVEYIKNEKWER